ncbi:hypothetical protein PLANPX_1611 [Lacipirellula parvula]|uniref:Uncharacterized protein n=2 Tax=Lacipirellula parvula TaxID=2650471 RepID=A0A5K7XGA6_9BACT|nr:hypothetical protein PLANPX_1611 [Lacipirellula parvula]
MSKLLRAMAVGYFGLTAGTTLAVERRAGDSIADGIELTSACDSIASDECCNGVGCGEDVSLDLGCGCPSLWTVRAGAVIMKRERPNAGVLAVSDPGNNPISNTADFAFDWTGGPDVSIVRQTASGNAWELRYFGILDAEANRDYGDPGNFNILPYGFNTSNSLTANYESTLHSTELNWLHPFSQRVTWLAGFRWIELNDHLTYTVGFPSPSIIDVNYNMQNHLYGAQTGADVALWNRGGRLTVNGIVKAGVYGNSADSNIYEIDNDGDVLSDGGASSSHVAFVGDLSFVATYQVTPHFALRGGYQLLWLDGVALASNTALLAKKEIDKNVIGTDGSLFYNGALVGGEFTW